MKKSLTLLASLAFVVSVLGSLYTSTPAAASVVTGTLKGDGLSWTVCSPQHLRKTVYFGVARMKVFTCANGYTYASVSSSTKSYKSVGVARNSPYPGYVLEPYGVGGTLYSRITKTMSYRKGMSYTAWATSSDSNGGKKVEYTYVWKSDE